MAVIYNSPIPRGINKLAIHKMAASYKKKFSYVFRAIETYLPTKPLRVLDLGCGPGYALVDFHNRYNVSSLYGIDSMLEAIEFCDKVIRDNKIKRKTRLFHMDLEKEKIPIPDQFIDVAVACQLVHALSDPLCVIGQISKKIKYDGLLVIFDWVRFTLGEAFEMWGGSGNDLYRGYRNWLRFSRFDVNDLRCLLSVTGFEELEVINVPWYGDGIPLSSGKCISALLIGRRASNQR